MAKKKKAARKKPARRSLGAGGKRASRKHMTYYCVRCGAESMRKMRHHGKMMEKC